MQKVLILNILSLAISAVAFGGVTITGDGKVMQLTITYDDQGKTKTDKVCLISDGTNIANGGRGDNCLEALKKLDRKLPKDNFPKGDHNDWVLEERKVSSPKNGIGLYDAEKIFAHLENGKLVLVEQSAKVGGNPPRVITNTIVTGEPSLGAITQTAPAVAPTLKVRNVTPRDQFNSIEPSSLEQDFDQQTLESKPLEPVAFDQQSLPQLPDVKAPECSAKKGTPEFCEELKSQKCHLQGRHELAGVCGTHCGNAKACVHAYDKYGPINDLNNQMLDGKKEVDKVSGQAKVDLLQKLEDLQGELQKLQNKNKCNPSPKQYGLEENQAKIASLRTFLNTSCKRSRLPSSPPISNTGESTAPAPAKGPDSMSGQSNPPCDPELNGAAACELHDMKQPAHAHK